MKITKTELKKIVREELTKQKRGILTEDSQGWRALWWGWDLNEFEPMRDDTLAFIKSSEGKLKQIASVAIKGLTTLKQGDLKGHELVRQKVHAACLKFSKEWAAVNAKYKSGGEPWLDATSGFSQPFTHDDKLLSVDQLKHDDFHSDFLELVDALHPDFQKSRLPKKVTISSPYIKNIRKLVEQGNFKKARNVCAGGIMILVKLPKAQYKYIERALQEILDTVVSKDAWKTETDAFLEAWIKNPKEAESKAKQVKLYGYLHMIEAFKWSVIEAWDYKGPIDYYTGNPTTSSPGWNGDGLHWEGDGKFIDQDSGEWNYEDFITWRWKCHNAEENEDTLGDALKQLDNPDDQSVDEASGNETIKRSEIYKMYPWNPEEARGSEISDEVPKGFLPSHRIFAKGVKTGS